MSDHSILSLAQASAVVRAAKPGWKTTEFAVLAVLAAAGLALIVGGLVLDDRELLVQGVELAKWTGAAYGVVRGAVKMMAVRAPALAPEPKAVNIMTTATSAEDFRKSEPQV